MPDVTVYVHPTVAKAYMAMSAPGHTVDQKHIWPGNQLTGYRAEMIYVYPGALEKARFSNEDDTEEWFRTIILPRLVDDNPARVVYL